VLQNEIAEFQQALGALLGVIADFSDKIADHASTADTLRDLRALIATAVDLAETFLERGWFLRRLVAKSALVEFRDMKTRVDRVKDDLFNYLNTYQIGDCVKKVVAVAEQMQKERLERHVDRADRLLSEAMLDVDRLYDESRAVLERAAAALLQQRERLTATVEKLLDRAERTLSEGCRDAAAASPRPRWQPRAARRSGRARAARSAAGCRATLRGVLRHHQPRSSGAAAHRDGAAAAARAI
jgi:hypothetical protein